MLVRAYRRSKRLGTVSLLASIARSWRACCRRRWRSPARAALSRAPAENGQFAGHPGVQVEKIKRGDTERSGGRRFGALAHAILASVDLDADADAIQASAAVNGRLVGATEEEMRAAITAVGSALAHPILRRAVAAVAKGKVRRETPVVVTLDEGSLVEGGRPRLSE